MKVYRIWNVAQGCWYKSSSRSIWMSLSGVNRALNYYNKRKKFYPKYYPDYLIIKVFELMEIEAE